MSEISPKLALAKKPYKRVLTWRIYNLNLITSNISGDISPFTTFSTAVD